MDSILKKVKTNSLITAIIYAVLGFVLLVWPGLSVDVLCKALGTLLLVCGIVDVIIFLVNRDGSVYAASHLIIGVVLAAVGIWLLTEPTLVAVIIPRIIGILICIHGISDISQTLTLQHNGYPKWATALVLGILTLVLGAILIYDPFDAFTTVIRFIGVFLLYDGISDIWIVSRVSSTLRRVKKDAEAAAKAVDVEYRDVGDVDAGR